MDRIGTTEVAAWTRGGWPCGCGQVDRTTTVYAEPCWRVYRLSPCGQRGHTHALEVGRGRTKAEALQDAKDK
jgi:hypothetical protein